MKLTVENRSTGGKICPSATLSNTNPIWTDPGSNPGLRIRYLLNTLPFDVMQLQARKTSLNKLKASKQNVTLGSQWSLSYRRQQKGSTERPWNRPVVETCVASVEHACCRNVCSFRGTGLL
jgi:hypothetical protein